MRAGKEVKVWSIQNDALLCEFPFSLSRPAKSRLEISASRDFYWFAMITYLPVWQILFCT